MSLNNQVLHVLEIRVVHWLTIAALGSLIDMTNECKEFHGDF